LTAPQDLPILVAALREECPWMVTFNVRDLQPGYPQGTLMHPGEFILIVGEILAHLRMDE